jgi:hypothetical protein
VIYRVCILGPQLCLAASTHWDTVPGGGISAFRPHSAVFFPVGRGGWESYMIWRIWAPESWTGLAANIHQHAVPGGRSQCFRLFPGVHFPVGGRKMWQSHALDGLGSGFSDSPGSKHTLGFSSIGQISVLSETLFNSSPPCVGEEAADITWFEGSWLRAVPNLAANTYNLEVGTGDWILYLPQAWGLELFSAFLCCLGFSMLFFCPTITFMISDAPSFFLSSEYRLSVLPVLSLIIDRYLCYLF